MNKKRRHKKRVRARLELWFRALRNVNWKLTSRATKRYNCLAWAVGENHRRWEAGNGFWPDNIARDLSLVTLVRAYITRGFVACPEKEGRTYNSEYETIVLYEAFELFDMRRPHLGGEMIG